MTPSPQKSLFDFYQETIDKIPLDLTPPIKPNKSKKPNKRDSNYFAKIMMYGVTAGLCFCGDWGDTFPQDLREKAKIIRLATCKQCVETKLCSQMDALAYMYSLSLTVAPDITQSNIYFHLVKEELPEQWEILKKDDYFQNRPKIEQYELDMLKRLRHWIFEQQIKNMK